MAGRQLGYHEGQRHLQHRGLRCTWRKQQQRWHAWHRGIAAQMPVPCAVISLAIMVMAPSHACVSSYAALLAALALGVCLMPPMVVAQQQSTVTLGEWRLRAPASLSGTLPRTAVATPAQGAHAGCAFASTDCLPANALFSAHGEQAICRATGVGTASSSAPSTPGAPATASPTSRPLPVTTTTSCTPTMRCSGTSRPMARSWRAAGK